MASKLDWSTMLAIHGALRRDLEQVARIAGRKDGVTARAFGPRWDGSSSRSSWSPTTRSRTTRSGRCSASTWPVFPDQVAVVDALEAEHAVIEPLLEAVDNVAADPHER